MPGTVLDKKADVMRDLELGIEMRGSRGNFDAARAVREGEQIADHGNRRGMAAGAMAGEDHVAAIMAAGDDHVLRALRPGKRRTQSDEHGTDGGSETAFHLLGARNLANGAAEIARITEIDGGDRR